MKKDDELSIYVERMIRLIQLLRIYEKVLVMPEECEDLDPHLTMRATMLSVVYSFFYSLIERDPNGIDFFRIWRTRAPEMASELDTLEARVQPMKDDLRVFRNRFGFHGSTSREHEAAAFKLLEVHTGTEIYNVILDTRNLSAKLLHLHVGQE